VEYYHEQYFKSLRLLNEATAGASVSPAMSFPMERGGSSDGAPSPAIRPAPFSQDSMSNSRPRQRASSNGDMTSPQSPGLRRNRRVTSDSFEHGLFPSPMVDKRNRRFPMYDGISDDDLDVEEFLPLTSPVYPVPSQPSETHSSNVTGRLSHELFTEPHLARHLAALDESRTATVAVLDDLWPKRGDFVTFPAASSAGSELGAEERYSSATYEVYNINADAIAVAQHVGNGDEDDETLDAKTVWETIKEVNSKQEAVGRMT
jgi:hypothetical protein